MEETDVSVKTTFGRRTFIKGSAAVLGVAALAGVGCSPSSEVKSSSAAASSAGAPVDSDQHFFGVCRGNCFGGCALDISVRDGKVVATNAAELPEKDYMRICQRGHTHLQRIYDPERLKTPIRRVGERGAGEWEEISWDEAIEEISSKWKSYIEESGPESIAFFGGSGNFGSAANNAPARLRDKLHATQVQFCYDNCYFHAGISGEGVGDGFNANEIADIVNAKVVVLWGTNPAVAQPQNWGFIMSAKQAGAKIVVIDPNFTVSAQQADVFIPIRPTTDAAFLMAVITYCVQNGLIDEETIKTRTVGPYLVKEDGKFLRMSDLGVEPQEVTDPNTGAVSTPDPIVFVDADGNHGTAEDIADPAFEGEFEIEGIKVTTAYTKLVNACAEWTPERAAELCDLPVETITDFAELYAAGPSTIYQGFGPDHYVNGERAYFCQIALAAITGNISKPGASCGYDWTYAGLVKFITPALAAPADAASGHVVVSPNMLDVKKNGAVEGYPIDIRSLYIWNSNPIANQTERNSWLEFFDLMDLVVVADMRLGDTANYADIVLPVVHWFENTEIMAMTSPYLLIQEKAVDPLYESKEDVEIINLIAQAMGFEEDFNMTTDEYISKMFNGNCEAAGISWDRLKEEKYIDIMGGDPFYIHGESGVYRTATGKINFYYENPAPYINYGQTFEVEKNRLPYWEPPHEAWPETVAEFEANPLAEQYPIIFTTERNRMKCHTQFGHTPWLLELYPEPIIRMNPVDAEARGIADGDYVRAFNDRGECTFKAQLQPGVRPGMVIAPKGWEEDQFKAGHYSTLTSRVYNPFTPNNCYFDTLVQIEKA